MVRACAAAGIFLLAILPLPVLAAEPADPDNLEVRSVIACRDLIEDGDMAIAVHYNIDYSLAGEPSQSARELFWVRVLADDIQLAVVQPFSYFNNGYDMGIVLLYWTAATAPAWGEEYTVIIQGTPAAWADPPQKSFTLGGSNYSGVTGQTANQQALYDWMITALQSLEENWGVSLLDTSSFPLVLNATGQSYMTGAIPGLQSLCPGLFWIRSASMDTSERKWGTEQADAYASRYDGTWVGQSLTAAGGLFGVSPQLMGSILIVLLPFIIIMIISERTFFTSTPALIALPLLLAMGALMGFLSMALFAVVVICFVLFLGYVLFFRTS